MSHSNQGEPNDRSDTSQGHPGAGLQHRKWREGPRGNRVCIKDGASPTAPFRANPSSLRPVGEAAEIKALTRGTVQASMEVLAGIRPIHQLARRLDPRCLASLQHRAALIRRELTRTGNPALARLHRNSTVRSVRVCEVADGIYEASAVVVDDVRARAVAVRLERSKQVWRIVELVIG